IEDNYLHDTKVDKSNIKSTLFSEEKSITAAALPPTKHRLCGIFIVNKDVGYLNLSSYLIACFATICMVAYLSIVQPFVLTVLLGITENTGNLTGSLALYVTSNEAEFGAMVGMFAGFGGLVSGMVLIKLPFQMSVLAKDDSEGIQWALIIIGGNVVVLVFIFAFTMPNTNVPRGTLRRTLKGLVSCSGDLGDTHHRKIENPFKMFKGGFIAGRDPRVALAYFSRFVARADTVLFTSYMSLWVIRHFLDLSWCRDRKPCMAAAGDSHELTGFGQGISLAFAPVFGYAGERFKKSSVLAVLGIIGAIGSLPFGFTMVPPADKSNMVWICMIGMIVTGMGLLNGSHMNPKYRGSVAGVFSFCGAISIMVMAKLGGYLFDVWMRGAPFVLMGITHLLIAVFGIYVSPGHPTIGSSRPRDGCCQGARGEARPCSRGRA
ncbi:hypothetical protein BGX33_001627, partial [Mortierella sp. NVP41]